MTEVGHAVHSLVENKLILDLFDIASYEIFELWKVVRNLLRFFIVLVFLTEVTVVFLLYVWKHWVR